MNIRCMARTLVIYDCTRLDLKHSAQCFRASTCVMRLAMRPLAEARLNLFDFSASIGAENLVYTRKCDGLHADLRQRKRIYRKAEQTRPTRDFKVMPETVGARGRISQPAGKSLGI